MKVFIALSVLVALAHAEPPAYRQQNQRRYYFARQEEQTTSLPEDEAPYPASGWKPDGPAFELPQKQFKNTYEPSSDFGSRVDQKYGAPDSEAKNNQEEQKEQQRFSSSEFQTRQRQQQRQFSASQQSENRQRQYLAPFAYQPQINQYGVPDPQEQFQPPQPDQQYGVPFATTTEEPATTTEIEDATTTTTPQTDSEVEPVNSVNELDEEGDLDDQQSEQQQQRKEGEYYVALPDGRLQRIQYVSHEDLESMKYFARIRAENVEPLRGPIYSYAPLQELQFAPAGLRIAQNPAVSSTSSSSAETPSSVQQSIKSGKLELEEEAAPSPPLAAVVQYSYGAPSPVIPLNAAARYSANYRVQNTEPRYILTF